MANDPDDDDPLKRLVERPPIVLRCATCGSAAALGYCGHAVALRGLLPGAGRVAVDRDLVGPSALMRYQSTRS
jgi:hypothetical protein